MRFYDVLLGRMNCTGFKAVGRNTLVGFADVEMPSGLIVKEVTIHEANGKRWASPPSKPAIDADRRQIIGPNGKPTYTPILAFRDSETRNRWVTDVLAAVDAFLDGKTPAGGGRDENRGIALGNGSAHE